MESLRQTAPDRLEIRSGGGCLSLFGVPFFGAGIFVTLVGLGVITPDNADEIPAWGWPLLTLMGAVFVAVGGGLVLGRRWIAIDRSRGTVTRQWGLLVPMKVEETLLHEFGAVRITFKAGDSDTADRYPVVLEPRAGGKDYELLGQTEYHRSHEQAVQIAGVLGLPLKDATTENEVVLAPDGTDRTGRREERARDAVARPASMRSHVREEPGGVVITFARPALGAGSVLQIAIPIAVVLWIIAEFLPFFDATNTPEFVQWAFLGFAALFLLIPLTRAVATMLRAGKPETIVTATPAGIRIEGRTARRSRTIEIPADQILHVDYSTVEGMKKSGLEAARQSGRAPFRADGELPSWARWIWKLARSKGITVKARTGLHVFAAGLPDDEVRYLHALVTGALARR